MVPKIVRSLVVVAWVVALAACSPAGTSPSSGATVSPTSASPSAAAVLSVTDAQALAKAVAQSGGGPVPVTVSGYLTFAGPVCEGAPMPTPTPSPTPDPIIQPCGALFMLANPVFEGSAIGPSLRVAPDRIPDAEWAAAASGQVWRPVIVAGHFGDPRLKTCPVAYRDYCDNLLVLDAIISVGEALPTPTTLDVTAGTVTRLGRAELTVPAGWTIQQSGAATWRILAPAPSDVAFTVGTRTDIGPFDPQGGVVAYYPGATSAAYDDSRGYEKWSVEFGRDLATRRSLVGFTVDGTTYELRFAWDTPVDELAQALVWFRQIAATFGKAP